MNIDNKTPNKNIIALKSAGLKRGVRPGAIDQILLKFEDEYSKYYS